MLHKISKASEVRDANYQIAGIIRVDDVFSNGRASKGGDKRGRGALKVPVLALAGVKDEGGTVAKLQALENVGDKTAKVALDTHVPVGKAVEVDGLAMFSVVKEIGHAHTPIVVYPKQGDPGLDALNCVNILVSTRRPSISAPVMASLRSIFRSTSTSSAADSAGASGRARALTGCFCHAPLPGRRSMRS